MSSVLVTGGAGFIGSHLVCRLHELGHQVTVVDRLSQEVHGERPMESYSFQMMNNKCHFVQSEVSDVFNYKQQLQQAEIVFYLAAETSNSQSEVKQSEYLNSNIDSFRIFLSELKNSIKLKKIILTSSRSVYGEGYYFCKSCGDFKFSVADRHLMDSKFLICCPVCKKNAIKSTSKTSDVPVPNSIYGRTKLLQEELLNQFCTELSVSSIILRLQNVYGVGQSLLNPYSGFLSFCVQQLIDGNDITVFEDGQQTRDFIYIDDVVQTLIKASLGGDNKAIKLMNVGSGNCHQLIDIIYRLRRMSESKSNININHSVRRGDDRHCSADFSELNQIQDLSSFVSIEEGLGRLYSWARHQNINR